ncbi:Ribosomal protein L34e superfamily protein [Perilla frutescens var. hirtella]|uniref:Ribosomal protein L34e superfamily protein n=1 Tax=Perilla frutescens var. hirtella TaxID=608512 RepID=A0AAD4P873_PERFH|nr:Ribosomal protein L34e superfamily protein [Perilla frutescens var. frutescens]KAH6792019.1 Ribosomal protein L34e superfamily protein [Perilla frutescens var. hirtella]KAH6830408.1 Ribosomal protein L34e superfamily protein [Perilla frutescens var. hirtella]
MVCFDSSISVDQHIGMAKSLNSADPCLKSKQINQLQKSKRNSISLNQLNIPACDQSRYAMIDVIILIAVVISCGFLLYPYARILAHKTVELGEEVVDVVSEEIVRAPMVFGCLGLSILFAAMALVAIAVCTDNRCGKSGCRGLSKAAEFDIQLETEESLKKSSCLSEASLKKGLFELPRDHHRELEAELKKMAPPNGRAVLVFRARCGCSVGRMEVLGARRTRKLKK